MAMAMAMDYFGQIRLVKDCLKSLSIMARSIATDLHIRSFSGFPNDRQPKLVTTVRTKSSVSMEVQLNHF